MDEQNNRNFLLAIVLSVAVMVLWQMLYAGPKIEDERKKQEQRQKQIELTKKGQGPKTGQPPKPTVTPGTAPTPSAETTTSAPQPVAVSRTSAIASSPRVKIQTPRLSGSIALKGARLDDLTLTKYRETVKKNSKLVTLLSPSGSPEPYYIEHGWVASAGGPKVPDANSVWKTDGNSTLTPSAPVTLTWDNGNGLVFKRVISVDDGYLFKVKQSVENKSGNVVTLFPYGLISRHYRPKTEGFFILHEGLIGFLGESKLQEIDYGDAIDAGKQSFKSKTGWFGITDKYWATALVPDQETEKSISFTGRRNGLKESFQTDYLMPSVSIPAGGVKSIDTSFFAGAKKNKFIEAYQEDLKVENFDLMIDWGWFWYITKPLFYVLDWLYNLLGNFGLAILGTTILVKALFFPLANKSYVSMSRMKKLQPEMEKIKERFGDDRQRQQKAMMELYQKEKVNPMAGCLPILLQIPVFFALYKVLFITIDMRHAPFFGWIQDLSAPDPTSIFNLFGLLPFTPPSFLTLGIWPIIMGVTMWLQMKLNPAPTDEIQKKIFGWMPVIFTFMLATFPAGLVIYWTWNNILSITQQWVIMARQGVKVALMDNLREDFGWIKNLFGKKAES